MSRRWAWKQKATDDDHRLIEQCLSPDLSSPTLFLLSEMGATQFILQSSPPPCSSSSPCPSPTPCSPTKHRVMIGDSQRCSCAQAKEGQRLCPHLIFVMLKVMRVDPKDPVLWQLSLTETEVTAVVKGRWEWREARKRGRAAKAGQREEGKEQLGAMQRRDVEAEDVCAVCQEELRTAAGAVPLGLTWCDRGCGSALHARCMRVWAEHQAQTHHTITCPVSSHRRTPR